MSATNRLFTLGLAALALWSLPAVARSSDPPEAVLKAFSGVGIDRVGFSVQVTPLEPQVNRRASSWGYNARTLRNPASVAKVFTTAYALERFGSEYRFSTDFQATAEPVDGVLQGPLYIRGSGDPTFFTTHLWSALHELRNRGIRTLQGNVVLDKTVFKRLASADEGLLGGDEEGEAFDDAPHRAYHAQPDALLMNHGAMMLDIEVNGPAIRVSGRQAPHSWAFVSELNGLKGGCGAWKNGLDVKFKQSADNVVVTVAGNYPLQCGSAVLPIRVAYQDWLWESWFREIWASLGGQWNGKMVEGKTPLQSVSLYTHYGEPVRNLIAEVNKWSSNVMARQLELATTPEDGTFNTQMQAWLNAETINTQGWFFENGSGLARGTKITAQGLNEFLQYVAGRADFPDFLASLPRAGASGTLARKVRNVGHYAYLKTGSLDGVKAVAGYVRGKSGQWYAVSVLVEHAKAYAAWPAMEKTIEAVYNDQ
ncbi:MAG: D-alanyl-D-alanine carboxypeptidase/D-alanyl-D-alanine-endopeptidase [Limnobacter sp.]|nr:D-alanyl-D-alanine carboxypeptidase/D-alanyl-D-alanine-endopeptidase [Limnobacter sp.]